MLIIIDLFLFYQPLVRSWKSKRQLDQIIILSYIPLFTLNDKVLELAFLLLTHQLVLMKH